MRGLLGKGEQGPAGRKAELARLQTLEELQRKRETVAGLYETHFERVARYLAVRIGNRNEAEDLASEVFLRALRGVEGYKETGAPMEAWLFRIAHNTMVDYLRNRSRRPASVSLEEAPPIAGGQDPVEPLERQQEILHLQQAMRHLSDAQRQVLALRFGGELTSEQVAAALGKKAGAIREMQSSALRKLRETLRKQSE